MELYMNIVFILGNGFDLNLGLNTSYNDFYEYYKQIESNNEAIIKLKNELFNNFENWSDLEFSLGKYTLNINTLDEFDEVFEDILEHLSLYLKIEENKLNNESNKVYRDKLLEHLAKPINFLTDIDIDILNRYFTHDIYHKANLNILTFNYTKSLELLINYNDSPIIIPNNTILQKIYHVHGFIDEKMIMGVNDISQLSNKDFHNNQDIKDAIIKEESNKATGHTIDAQCENLITSANVICIFGSSLGQTDNKWWIAIGNRLKYDSNFKLIIFEKVEDIHARIERKKDRIRRKKKNEFLDKTDLNNEEREKVKNNIFIGINTKIFDDICIFEETL